VAFSWRCLRQTTNAGPSVAAAYAFAAFAAVCCAPRELLRAVFALRLLLLLFRFVALAF